MTLPTWQLASANTAHHLWLHCSTGLQVALNYTPTGDEPRGLEDFLRNSTTNEPFGIINYTVAVSQTIEQIAESVISLHNTFYNQGQELRFVDSTLTLLTYTCGGLEEIPPDCIPYPSTRAFCIQTEATLQQALDQLARDSAPNAQIFTDTANLCLLKLRHWGTQASKAFLAQQLATHNQTHKL